MRDARIISLHYNLTLEQAQARHSTGAGGLGLPSMEARRVTLLLEAGWESYRRFCRSHGPVRRPIEERTA